MGDIVCFKSIYSSYKGLKFAFEYGLDSEEEVLKLLFKKELKEYKSLIRPMAEHQLSNTDQIDWGKTKKNKKCGRAKERKVINKNSYNFLSDKWFHVIYSLYGFNNEKMEDSEKLKEQFGKKARILENMISVRNNLWCSLQEDVYTGLQGMIEFFSEFSFLGSLGYLLKNHIGCRSNKIKLNRQSERNYFYVRGTGIGYGLSQESIYRCLGAIYEERSIIFRYGYKERVEGIPIKVFYQHPSFYEEKAYPFIRVYLKDKNDIVNIPLYNGIGIYHNKKVHKSDFKDLCFNKTEIKEIEMCKVKICFYYNDIEQNGENTEYINKKIDSLWTKQRISKHVLDKTKNFNSIYYGDIKWKVLECEYHISEIDYPKFKQWIQSFGEFAEIISEQKIKNYNNYNISLKLLKNSNFDCEDYMLSVERLDRPKEDYTYSLCTPYDSQILNSKVDLTKYPPTAQEIFWLEFILDNYPNLCNMILESYSYHSDSTHCSKGADIADKIKDILKIEKLKINNGLYREKAFNPFQIDKQLSQSTVQDISEDCVEKYSYILKAIRGRKFMKYTIDEVEKENKKRQVEKFVLPYAFEYNILTSKSKDKERRHPFTIMMYDMKQKRVINAKMESIKVKNSNSEEKTSILQNCDLSIYDKLYHIIAFFIRAKNNEQKIPDIISTVVDVFRKEKKQKGEYEISDVKAFLIEQYEETIKMITQSEQLTGAKIFLVDAYQYICDYLEEKDGVSEYERELEMHGVTKIGEEEISYRMEILLYLKYAFQALLDCHKREKLISYLQIISVSDIYELIAGNPFSLLEKEKSCEKKGSKQNEMSYMNEKLKSSKVAFTLKKELTNEEDERLLERKVERLTEEDIDKVYDIFREFICWGEWECIEGNNIEDNIEDKKGLSSDKVKRYKIKFMVEYERFYYRKVHAGLLALSDYIENIYPEEVKNVIETRENTKRLNKTEEPKP